MSVVERVVLKWSHVIKPPGKLWICHMSNISTNGDVAVAVTYGKGVSEYGELTLFNSDGEIAWSRQYDNAISNPQLSDNGNIITVRMGSGTLEAYNKRGELLWTYSVEKGRVIRDYKLSRDGKYAVIAVHDIFRLKGHFILLREGVVEWVKSSKGVAIEIAISPNNAYIASASYGVGKRNIHVTLYTIDGVELWNTVVEGYPFYIDVSDNGEVILVNDLPDDVFADPFLTGRGKIFFIAEGRVLWAKDYYPYAEFTRREDRIITVRNNLGLSDWSIDVFDRKGELLWNYWGAFDFAVSDDYYVLMGDKGLVLVSAKGEVLQLIKLSELINKEIEPLNVDITISPDGKYFAVSAKGGSEGACYLYFFENRDPLIRGIKEKLIKDIEELIKE